MITEEGLEIIDRKKHIVKLSQGEFVSPEHLEVIYIESRYVDQIYVHVDPLSSYLVAVVVPNLPCMVTDDPTLATCTSARDLNDNVNSKKMILDSLRKVVLPHLTSSLRLRLHLFLVPVLLLFSFLFYSLSNCLPLCLFTFLQIAVAHQLAPYELILGILIDLETWTPQNGRMTASVKLCRPALKLHYSPLLPQIYAEVDSQQSGNVTSAFLSS
jgi:long-subunit acyl-CoA synthetase (AMP-forming)